MRFLSGYGRDAGMMPSSWELRAAPRDVEHLYQILLGRDADAGAVDHYSQKAIKEVVVSLASSDEFAMNIIGPTLRGARVPHDALVSADVLELAIWLDLRLDLRVSLGVVDRGLRALLTTLCSCTNLNTQLAQLLGPSFEEAMQRMQQLLEPPLRVAAATAAASWDELATKSDIPFLYLAFLGRPVEDTVLESFAARPLREVVKGLAESLEVNEQVMHAVVQHRDLPHALLDDSVLANAARWLVQRLGIGDSAQPAAATGIEVLGKLFAHTVIADILLCAHGSLFFETVHEVSKLQKLGRSRLRGAIEFVNSEIIGGFLTDVTGQMHRVQMEVRCSGRLVASGVANVHRPDVVQHFGGNGVAGFRLRWAASALPAGSWVLTLHEATSGLQFGGGYRFENSYGEQMNIVQRLVKELDSIRQRLDVLSDLVPQVLSYSAFAFDHHDLYRRSHQVPKPEDANLTPKHSFLIILDATDASSTAVRQSMDSIREQSNIVSWKALITSDRGMGDDAARLLSAADNRCQFVQGVAAAADVALQDLDANTWVILLQASEVFVPTALTWIEATARSENNVAGVYWDEDELVDSHVRRLGTYARHANPVLRAPFDPDAMLELNIVGTSFAVRGDVLTKVAAPLSRTTTQGKEQSFLSLRERERFVWAVLKHGAWAHVPQFLVTRHIETMVVAGKGGNRLSRLVATETPDVLSPLLPEAWKGHHWIRVADPVLRESSKRLVYWFPTQPEAVISVLIPIKDQVAMLADCLDSLVALATRVDLLDVVIADNGSEEEDTLRYLAAGSHDGRFRVLSVSEPFNWSRLSNLLAEQAKGEHLLFMNNDMRMLTKGWDEVIRGNLDRRHVGAVGARLLYEDMTIQHAGVVSGREGLVAHDALGEALDAERSIQGSRLTRAMPAVTGAFLACRASTFKAVGGFDELNLPVTFNDVDWCWRLINRFPEMVVLYAPLLSLIHYESKSRGLDFSDAERQARASYEAQRLLTLHRVTYPVASSEHPRAAVWTISNKALR